MKKIGGIILLLAFAAFTWAEGELPGRFVINDKGDVVCFSQGNLVYTRSTNQWSFAEHQYDVIGDKNVADDDLADKIDLFGWSADGATARNYGVSSSDGSMQYAGNFREWGQNKIINGGNKMDVWRTLSAEEWTYLIANNNPFPTIVNGVKGIAIMPHDVHLDVKPASYTAEEWLVDEKKGVVFLPFTGYREGTNLSDFDKYGFYWTATSLNTEAAYVVRCNDTKVEVRDKGLVISRMRGHAVRLVKEASACTVMVSAVSGNPMAGNVTITIIDE